MTTPSTPPQRRVVAELGRPETPQETADRKAETSRRHREGQTLFNLVLALIATLAVVLIVVLVVVRQDPPAREPIDYAATAAQSGSEVPLAAPVLPEGWWANSVHFDASPPDGVTTWYIGFITPQEQFIAVRQGVGANPTWVANQLGARASTGSVSIDGATWQVYDHRDLDDVGNLAYGMVFTGSDSSYVLFGTATVDEFETIAQAMTSLILADDGKE